MTDFREQADVIFYTLRKPRKTTMPFKNREGEIIPANVLSRWKRDFTGMPAKQIAARLAWFASQESVDSTPDPLEQAKRIGGLVGKKVIAVYYCMKCNFSREEVEKFDPQFVDFGLMLNLTDEFPFVLIPSSSHHGFQIGMVRQYERDFWWTMGEGSGITFQGYAEAWKPYLDQEIISVQPGVYLAEQCGYFEEEELYWDEQKGEFTKEVPGSLIDLEITFANGRSLYVMAAACRPAFGKAEAKLERPGNELLIFFDRAEAESFGFGTDPFRKWEFKK